MFDLFSNRPRDVKEIRNSILQFIKEQLQKTEGGEGFNIRGLYLYINCLDSERHLYESALYLDDPERFKQEEVQKIADDFAIELPASWTMKVSFDKDAPTEAIPAKNMEVSLVVSTFKNPVLHKRSGAFINVLVGEAMQQQYRISSDAGRINIGRAAGVHTPDGFFRKNHIAFLDSDQHPVNRAVSRQHAHIEWDPATASFFLFADEGGIPPFNKVKVRAVGGTPTKLLSTEIGHRLQEGDQVVLGESALLEFTFTGQ